MRLEIGGGGVRPPRLMIIANRSGIGLIMTHSKGSNEPF